MTPGNWEASSPFFLIQPAAVVAGEKIEEEEEEGKASVSDSEEGPIFLFQPAKIEIFFSSSCLISLFWAAIRSRILKAGLERQVPHFLTGSFSAWAPITIPNTFFFRPPLLFSSHVLLGFDAKFGPLSRSRPPYFRSWWSAPELGRDLGEEGPLLLSQEGRKFNQCRGRGGEQRGHCEGKESISLLLWLPDSGCIGGETQPDTLL